MANPRRLVLLGMYAFSVILSILLFFLAGVYCQVNYNCSLSWAEKIGNMRSIFPSVLPVLLLFYPPLLGNAFSRVFLSFSGVCAVIEIHYNFDSTLTYMYWSEKWAFAMATSVMLVFLHAGLAFALT
uniref:Uncharacterized protein n=1 Tax=Ditylenchus dipsaci TaxID=166011 RepID=A0A915DFU2_9BILA